MTQQAQSDSPIILAFSGGLDTSFCVPWLKETYKRPVITVCVNTGGLDAAAASDLHDRAMALYFDFLADHPNSSRALDVRLLLAKSYWQQGKTKQAVKEIQTILDKTKEGEVRGEAVLLQADILMAEECTYTFRNDLSELEPLGRAVDRFGQKLGLNKKCLFEIHLALEEHFTNVVSHGYQDDHETGRYFQSGHGSSYRGAKGMSFPRDGQGIRL